MVDADAETRLVPPMRSLTMPLVSFFFRESQQKVLFSVRSQLNERIFLSSTLQVLQTVIGSTSLVIYAVLHPHPEDASPIPLLWDCGPRLFSGKPSFWDSGAIIIYFSSQFTLDIRYLEASVPAPG